MRDLRQVPGDINLVDRYWDKVNGKCLVMMVRLNNRVSQIDKNRENNLPLRLISRIVQCVHGSEQ
jgi:hypothetical protein